jgi:hypothetical protein
MSVVIAHHDKSVEHPSRSFAGRKKTFLKRLLCSLRFEDEVAVVQVVNGPGELQPQLARHIVD